MDIWNDLKGKTIKIWENGRNGKVYYSTSLGNKKEDGSYENMYISVQLPKTAVIHNGDEILIDKGFITFYKDNNGLPKLKIVIMEINNIDFESNYEDTSDLPF